MANSGNNQMEDLDIQTLENGDFMVSRFIETDQPENLPALLQMPATPIPAVPKKVTIGTARNMTMFVGTKIVCTAPQQQNPQPGGGTSAHSSQSAQLQQSGQSQHPNFGNDWRQPPSHYSQPDADVRAQPSQGRQVHTQSPSDVQPYPETNRQRQQGQGTDRAFI